MAIDLARRRRFCSSVSTMPFSLSLSSMPASCSSQQAAAGSAQPVIDQEHREQYEEIEDRNAEQPLGGPIALVFVTQDLDPEGEPDHRGAGRDRGHAVKQAGITQ